VCNNVLAGSDIEGIRPIFGAGVCVITFSWEPVTTINMGFYYIGIVGAGVCVITFWQEASYNHQHGLLLYRERRYNMGFYPIGR